MFSQTAEYALRVVVFLGGLGGKPATIRQIHNGTLIPEDYLAKVLQVLVRAQLLRSQRGLHGGSVLAIPPEQLSVYAVIRAVHPLTRIKGCPLKIKGHEGKLCSLHRRLDQAMATVEQAFRNSTIAELLDEPSATRPLGPRKD
jgi:Rrf2 family transcriptional regulator, nitric oxide-sensitive transcriptional repressor